MKRLCLYSGKFVFLVRFEAFIYIIRYACLYEICHGNSYAYILIIQATSFKSAIAFFVSVLPKLNLEELSLEQFHRIIDVNLLGAFLVSKVSIIIFCSIYLFWSSSIKQ